METRIKIPAAMPPVKPRRSEYDGRRQTSIRITDTEASKNHIIKISTSENKDFLNIELSDYERPFSFEVQE